MRGACAALRLVLCADGVGEESLSLTEDYSHPSLIVADVGRTFPKFGTNFLCHVEAHNFLPGSTKLHMLSCNSTYFPTAHLPGGDKADRFTKQLLSEFSGWKWATAFPHDRQLTNNGEAGGDELTISALQYKIGNTKHRSNTISALQYKTQSKDNISSALNSFKVKSNKLGSLTGRQWTDNVNWTLQSHSSALKTYNDENPESSSQVHNNTDHLVCLVWQSRVQNPLKNVSKFGQG